MSVCPSVSPLQQLFDGLPGSGVQTFMFLRRWILKTQMILWLIHTRQLNGCYIVYNVTNQNMLFKLDHRLSKYILSPPPSLPSWLSTWSMRASSNGETMKEAQIESKQSFTQCLHSVSLQTSDLITHTQWMTLTLEPACPRWSNKPDCVWRNAHTHSHMHLHSCVSSGSAADKRKSRCVRVKRAHRGRTLKAFLFTWNFTTFLCFNTLYGIKMCVCVCGQQLSVKGETHC